MKKKVAVEKVFNPDKCPYEQIKKHKGPMIIYLSSVSNGKVTRIRYYYRGKFRFASGPNFFYLPYSLSCFHLELPHGTKEEIIEIMKEFDARTPREQIVHIDFY